MKNSAKYQAAFNYFKQSYSYKMGGTQTVILPNGKQQFFDEREYYSGKGSKYNANIKHDDLGIVKVSKKDYSEFLEKLRYQETEKKETFKRLKAKKARIADFKNKGLYSIENNYIELSDDEYYWKTYDAKRLANTLNISIEDAYLLKSEGKTYVFAKVLNSETILELYHADLSCNHLSIYVKEATKERIAEFNHKEWSNAPFAEMVGQTANKNHFVC